MRKETLVFIMFVLGVLVLSGCGQQAGNTAVTVTLSHEKTPLVRQKIAALEKQEELYRQQLKQDIAVLNSVHPFRFTAGGTGHSSLLALTGIIWDEIEPQAIINDTIVSVGDIIGDKIVIEITRTHVVLLGDSEEYVLELQFEE